MVNVHGDRVLVELADVVHQGDRDDAPDVLRSRLLWYLVGVGPRAVDRGSAVRWGARVSTSSMAASADGRRAWTDASSMAAGIDGWRARTRTSSMAASAGRCGARLGPGSMAAGDEGC